MFTLPPWRRRGALTVVMHTVDESPYRQPACWVMNRCVPGLGVRENSPEQHIGLSPLAIANALLGL